ncbi:MAG: FAD-dependent oxidoreductase [Actinobacteria bacterium]|uniref:Unannotated protein n=1 Tax=freshwater metagenome TaxID=449393 RepID=A0A6J7Q4Z0_9ZZZZ|nr:FAD-dependent oxidoreductase [Actinomycetota bacterium]
MLRPVPLKQSRDALVLGSGIQGCCTALALARQGWSVRLLDRTPLPWSATSLRGEGKLHLGYVYANEADRRTAATMLNGAFSFSGLLDRWTDGCIDWAAVRSTPFLYGVLPGTMVQVGDLAEHYAWVDGEVARRLSGGETYAGLSSLQPACLLDDHRSHGLTDGVAAGFATDEVALNPRLLRTQVLDALARHGVRFIGLSTVTAVERLSGGFSVVCRPTPTERTESGATATTHRADLVVNCLWEGRLRVDESFGIETDRPCSYRLKFGLHGAIDARTTDVLHSTTFVLGPFGDVVRFPGGRVYVSWYPECMTDRRVGTTIPPTWYAAIAGETATAERERIVRSSLDALAALAPAVSRLSIDEVAAGVVVAWGSTDIDDHRSELHRRYEIGVHDHDGYLSIDTGKFTMAPYFANLAVRAAG